MTHSQCTGFPVYLRCALRILLAACLLGGMLSPATMLVAEDDAIYERCLSQTDDPAPWCYQREVESLGDPDQCENILRYWPKAVGVHGQCYYALALKNQDCALCQRIIDEQLRRMCELDACK